MTMDVETYARRHPQLRPTIRTPPELIAALSQLHPGDLVLDVGCGEGGSLGALSRRHDGPRYLGIDASLVRARRAQEQGVDAVVADGTRMPVPEGSVALALSRHLIEHVPDDRAILREVSRVLRPGGRLYLETPLRLRGAWYPYRLPSGSWGLDPTHVREYPSSEPVVDMLTESGLACVSLRVRKLRFPVDEVLRKVLARVGLRQELAQGLERALPRRIPVLRYRELCLVAVKLPGSRPPGPPPVVR